MGESRRVFGGRHTREIGDSSFTPNEGCAERFGLIDGSEGGAGG